MVGENDRYIRFGRTVKRLLRRKANYAVLEGFLTVFIGEKITIDEMLESEGRAAGQRQATIDTALNLKNLGIDIATISKATRLTREEIAEL